MTASGILTLMGGTVQTDPFLHVVIPDSIDDDLANCLLVWFETEVAWQLSVIDEFYQLYDLDLRSVQLPERLRVFVEDSFLEDLRKRTEALMSARLGSKIDVTAHKMLTGCRIKIHTDYGPQRQTHRLLVHLNRGWKAEDGGLLMLLDQERPSPDSRNVKCYVPHHRRAIGFEISPQSFHAVSTVLAGERYALTFSFYGDS